MLLSVVDWGRNGAKIAQRKKSETFLCDLVLYFKRQTRMEGSRCRKIQYQMVLLL
jgi:hypothetical protein